ncbi:unnamed protein product [Arabidopsis thaliana]|uniref:(thale cress) hypothetical protein n=1 Tax=Arabidopsis thaliana TaxID=3702 RepID=A0A7G2FBE4_ARATH|nr:unnamed protein product [Arabidopsis thaliana]
MAMIGKGGVPMDTFMRYSPLFEVRSICGCGVLSFSVKWKTRLTDQWIAFRRRWEEVSIGL